MGRPRYRAQEGRGEVLVGASSTESRPRSRDKTNPVLYPFVLAIAVLVIDQVSKAAVRRAVPPGGSVSLIPGLFQLSHVRNTGAAFGILPQQQLFLLLTSLAAVVIILLYFTRASSWTRLVGIALGLELGGAAGNLIDRFRTGTVTDFLDFGFWPVFNLADSAIVIGAVLLLFALVRPGLSKGTGG